MNTDISTPAIGQPAWQPGEEPWHRKPSVIVRAAAHGLIQALDRDDFVVAMSTFGTVTFNKKGEPICIGCLATCTLQRLFNIRFTPKNIGQASREVRIKVINNAGQAIQDVLTLARLENSVDRLRLGLADSLYSFTGIGREEQTEKGLPRRVNSLFAENSETSMLEAPYTDDSLRMGAKVLNDFADWLERKGF